MRIITTREIVRQTKTYFELAETERVAVKRGNKYIIMVVANTPDKVFLDEEWIKSYLEIPVEYRCNPFDISPSGDIFWADKRNVEQLKKSVEAYEQQIKKDEVTKVSGKDELTAFLESI